ncbi:T9SS type A sorting domain-containing protein [candidate division WOR-3 bacterium]|uniref:T9SS type A sorting domain-containing protein n=1 Tax=candidate division WOR-3 bacterium TaxID=2052148 RepID=A0A9D5K7S9_UNCW3|nr:T9SS type A sorting domain-containing protein [candidate division WOR-3 bacterium]MBD3363842.1 T9SS type A sorting domain-containing protein [candidate division WOR-3 bacterium]
MGNRLKITLIIGSLALTLTYAAPVDIQTSSLAATSQTLVMNARFQEAGLSSVSYSQSMTQPKPLYDETGETLLAYVFSLEPEGFVIVTADDDLTPVIAYAEHGTFPWEEHPENVLLNMLRKDLSLRLEALPLTNEEVIERNNRQWEGMISGEPAYLDPGDSWPEPGSTETGGWVKTEWHQGPPYNDLCPIDPETGVRSYVGCVATAMAQIINYWQYPSSVTFTENDNYSYYPYPYQDQDTSIQIYAPDASISFIDYNNGNPSDEMCAALCYACGVSVGMQYSSEGSGAFTGDCEESLLKQFNYLNARFTSARDTDTNTFKEILEKNMKDSMPAILASSGHAYVCDGFRETEFVDEWHLNYGWGNSSLDCWYLLPDGVFDTFSCSGSVLNIEPPTRYVAEPIEEFAVISCAPNPFEDYVRIIYTLPEESEVKVDVLDKYGHQFRKIVDSTYSEGIHGVYWNGVGDNRYYASPGLYIIKLTTRTDTMFTKVFYGSASKRDSVELHTTYTVNSFPNPFSDEVTIKFFGLWENQTEAEIGIYDVSGRQIIRFPAQTFEYGKHEFNWNGKNQYGNPVSPGVYFIHVSSPLVSYTGKVIKIR